MPAEHMFWGNRKYGDGSRVPRRTYRCRATAKRPSSTLTHHCMHVTDHDGDHTCICGLTWAPKVDT